MPTESHSSLSHSSSTPRPRWADLRSTSCCPSQDEADATASFVEIISKVELRSDGIAVTLGIEVPRSRAGVRTSGILKLSQLMPLGLKRRGVETRIIIAAGDNLPRKLARCRPARRWNHLNREQRICGIFALRCGRWHSLVPSPRVNRAPRTDFIASPNSRITCQTRDANT